MPLFSTKCLQIFFQTREWYFSTRKLAFRGVPQVKKNYCRPATHLCSPKLRNVLKLQFVKWAIITLIYFSWGRYRNSHLNLLIDTATSQSVWDDWTLLSIQETEGEYRKFCYTVVQVKKKLLLFELAFLEYYWKKYFPSSRWQFTRLLCNSRP